MRFASKIAPWSTLAGFAALLVSLPGVAAAAEIHLVYPAGILSGDGRTMIDPYLFHAADGWSEKPFLQRTVDDPPMEFLGISGDGSTIVGVEGPNTEGQAFRWSEAEGMTRLSSLVEGGHSFARGVSDDGSVVVGASRDGRPYQWSAVRWTKEQGIQNLGTLSGAGRSMAFGVSADGAVITGMATSNRGVEAFRWTEEGGMLGLGGLPGELVQSIPSDLSADGSSIVGQTAKGRGGTPFRWTQAEGMVEFVFEGATSSELKALSGDGRLAVGHVVRSGEADAVVWEQGHAPRLLGDFLVEEYGLGPLLQGWRLTSAKSISDDGLTISGFGQAPSGEIVGWVLTVPEPPTALLVAAALVTIGCRRLRRR
jgi:probable HAF family extracellular repeat protein